MEVYSIKEIQTALKKINIDTKECDKTEVKQSIKMK